MRRVILYSTAVVVSLPLIMTLHYVRSHEPRLYRPPSHFLEKSSGLDDVSLLKQVISRITVNNPEADAKRNMRMGDCSFLAVAGLAVGLFDKDPRKFDDYFEMCGARIMDGTSDVIQSREYEELQESITAYAIRYNQYVFSELENSTRSPKGIYLRMVTKLRNIARKIIEP